MRWIHYFANPNRVGRFYDKISPFLWLLFWPLLAFAIYEALYHSPPDYRQGEMVRMMYIHVPSAWLALMLYTGLALSNLFGLVWRNPFGFLLARAIAPVGLCFTLICLVTGSLWGKPIWGTWWVWDARLTSMFVLMLLYIGFMLFIRSFSRPQIGEKLGAYLSLLGSINLPIIKYSVDWWYSLHQPASFSISKGSHIASSMALPLLLMFASLFLFSVFFIMLRVEKLRLSKRGFNS